MLPLCFLNEAVPFGLALNVYCTASPMNIHTASSNTTHTVSFVVQCCYAFLTAILMNLRGLSYSPLLVAGSALSDIVSKLKLG